MGELCAWHRCRADCARLNDAREPCETDDDDAEVVGVADGSGDDGPGDPEEFRISDFGLRILEEALRR